MPAVTFAQGASIIWSTLAGGSGTSTSAVYAVSGTVGQPDTGCMTGGAYTCEGGFWCVVAALQTPPGAPLSVVQSQGVVTVSWPLPATGWMLDQALTLTGATIPWSEVSASQYQTNATHISITVPTPSEANSTGCENHDLAHDFSAWLAHTKTCRLVAAVVRRRLTSSGARRARPVSRALTSAATWVSLDSCPFVFIRGGLWFEAVSRWNVRCRLPPANRCPTVAQS